MVAVVAVDVDRFHRVNETWGYDVGDVVLGALGSRLRDRFRAGDVVTQIGGDFALLCTASQSLSDHAVVTIGERIRNTLEEPVDVGGREVVLSGSVGIAVARAGTRAEGLLREAEAAAARAKQLGGARWEVADFDVRDRTIALVEMEHGLRHALENDELVLHYQPIVDVDTGAVLAVEALIRWARPDGGLVPPGAFVPVAEQSGLIVPIGRWVLEEVARQAASHPLLVGAVTGQPLAIAVNVSPRQLARPGLAAEVADVLRQNGIHPTRLCMELTESALVPDLVEAAAVLAELKAVGCALAIDDFGTGWSSLSHLRCFPVDSLKIDRSFVAGLDQPGGDRAIAEVIVTLGHALGAVAVAEGVETDEQLEVLRAMGCDRVQGFRLARPMPLDELADEVGAWR
jgi:diguanylate cyclase (GGDEF)-like protein